MTMHEDILCDFLECDKTWPSTMPSNQNHPFIKALTEVLMRLPQEVYDFLSSKVSFVVEDTCIMAINVPFERKYPPCKIPLEVRFDTIVLFHGILNLSHRALIGLLAHELAHSIITALCHKYVEYASKNKSRFFRTTRTLSIKNFQGFHEALLEFNEIAEDRAQSFNFVNRARKQDKTADGKLPSAIINDLH